MHQIIFFILFATLLPTRIAIASDYIYSHSKAGELAQKLDFFFKTNGLSPQKAELNQLYKELPRSEMNGQDLVELKFLFAFLRTHFSEPSPYSVEPRKTLPIRPIKSSAFPFSRWSKDPEFSNYEFSNEGVRIRGLDLRTGDILLVNHNEPTDQLFTSFTEDRGRFSHLAVFIILSRNGRRIPAVIEMHKKGVRAIPLSVFLNPKFISYAEIYRHNSPPQQWYEKLQIEGQRLLNESHGYDLHSDEDRVHLTCSEVGSVLWERTGALTIDNRSKISPHAALNLKKLGFEADTMLTPSDYSHSKQTHLVGTIDNGHYVQLVIRELVMQKIRELLTHCNLDLSNLPLRYELAEYLVRQSESHTSVAFALRTGTGFKKENFPAGPPGLMPFIPILSTEVTRAVHSLQKDKFLVDLILKTSSIHALETHPILSKRVQEAIAVINHWFSARCSSINIDRRHREIKNIPPLRTH